MYSNVMKCAAMYLNGCIHVCMQVCKYPSCHSVCHYAVSKHMVLDGIPLTIHMFTNIDLHMVSDGIMCAWYHMFKYDDV